MRDDWMRLRRATEAAVMTGAAETAKELRASVARGEAPPELAELVGKIRREAHRITDADVAKASASYAEDALFEVVVAATVGVAGEKLDRALAALDEATRS